MDTRFDKLRLEIQSAHPRQADVEDEAARRIGTLGIHEGTGGTVQPGGKPHRAQQAVERIAQRFIILDDVDDGCVAHAGCPQNQTRLFTF
ncbi:hypothetical protein ACFB49_14770 [Sphingomonas sp. DBB INV C78]